MENLPPPGFYPDASDESLERWWNGQGWSDATRPREGAYQGEPEQPEVTEGEVTGLDTDRTQEWDASLLPKSRWARFFVRRSAALVISVAVAIVLLGAPANTILGILGVYVPWLLIVSLLGGMALLGYGVVFHSDVRRRYGFRGKEPGRAAGKFISEAHDQARKNERGY